MNHETYDAIAIAAPHQRHARRRLSDKILIAFHHACDQADLEVAEQLLSMLDTIAPNEGYRAANAAPSGAASRRTQSQRTTGFGCFVILTSLGTTAARSPLANLTVAGCSKKRRAGCPRARP